MKDLNMVVESSGMTKKKKRCESWQNKTDMISAEINEEIFRR